MRHLALSLALALAVLMIACKGESGLTDKELIDQNVKDYFFLSDSVDVQVEITDTLHVEDLNELLATVENNIKLINQDLDTLSLMIDDKAYKKLAYEKEIEAGGLFRKNKYEDSAKAAEFTLLEYQLKQSQLLAKHNSFKQTNRILLHLQRSIWANVAGFNVAANYVAEGDSVNVDLLLDANFNVVD